MNGVTDDVEWLVVPAAGQFGGATQNLSAAGGAVVLRGTSVCAEPRIPQDPQEACAGFGVTPGRWRPLALDRSQKQARHGERTRQGHHVDAVHRTVSSRPNR